MQALVAKRREGRTGGAIDRSESAAALRAEGPEATAQGFGRALLARDPHAAAGYLSESGRILTPDGTEVAGRDAALTVLRQITDSEQELEIRIGRTLVNGAVALCTQYWRRHGGGGRRGAKFEQSTLARLVLAREGDRWEIVIASPWE
jgi:ketosteroid isomerase-like protein